jgi:hypothetical protein
MVNYLLIQMFHLTPASMPAFSTFASVCLYFFIAFKIVVYYGFNRHFRKRLRTFVRDIFPFSIFTKIILKLSNQLQKK